MESETRYFPQNPFSNKRRWISAVATVTAGIFILIVYTQSGPKAASFAQAEAIVANWSGVNSYDEMSDALRKVPSLKEKYEPFIVQKLIESGKGGEALEHGLKSLAAVREEAPYHAFFAETSFFIERGEFQEALERSAALKGKMAKEGGKRFLEDRLVGGSFLYAHNLLRIAFLQKALKNVPGEKSAWEELEKFLATKSAAAELLLKIFQEKGVDLTHYIADRKTHL